MPPTPNTTAIHFHSYLDTHLLLIENIWLWLLHFERIKDHSCLLLLLFWFVPFPLRFVYILCCCSRVLQTKLLDRATCLSRSFPHRLTAFDLTVKQPHYSVPWLTQAPSLSIHTTGPLYHLFIYMFFTKLNFLLTYWTVSVCLSFTALHTPAESDMAGIRLGATKIGVTSVCAFECMCVFVFCLPSVCLISLWALSTYTNEHEVTLIKQDQY